MKKIFTLISGLLLLSAQSVKADEVNVLVLNWDGDNKEYVDAAKFFTTELTKDNSGVYTLANINDSDNKIPLSFSFPEPEVGSYSDLKFSGDNLYRAKGYTSYPYILNNEGDYAVCVYKNVESGANFSVDYPIVSEAGYSWIEKYEPESSNDLQYWAYINISGYLADDSEFDSYLTVGFNYIMSPLEKANQEAYEAVLAEIEKVEADYKAALEQAEKENPDFDFSEWNEIIAAPLAQAKTAAEQALYSANEDGEEYSFKFDAEYYATMIAEMELAPLKAENQKAYEAVLAEIEKVEADYNEAVEDIKEVNPDFDFADYKEIEDKIAEAKKGAEQALNAANEDGEEFNYKFTGEDLEAWITEMKNAAGLSGIANIEAEVAAGKAKIFTLDGKAHFAPVKGQVNVIVRGNKSVKVMVK